MRERVRKQGAPLGQHFLTRPSIADKVADAGNIEKGETVLEIGPGKGILTRALLNKGARVIAIEKDPALAKFLKENFANEIKNETLEIVEGDIRDFFKLSTFDFPLSTHSYKVIANIPYYITGELMRVFLTSKHQPRTIVFLVQKEVAERIVGNPEQRRGARAKKESILSLSVKVYGTPKYVDTVKAGSFSPPPSVDSAILAIENISRNHFDSPIYGRIAEEKFFKIVKAGFAQKRKTLGGNLKKVFGERALHALAACEISEKTRAEDVPLTKWLVLTERMQKG